MSLLGDTIRKVRLEQGQQSIAPRFQDEIQTQVPNESFLQSKIREVRARKAERPVLSPFVPQTNPLVEAVRQKLPSLPTELPELGKPIEKTPSKVRRQNFKDVANLMVELPAIYAGIIINPALSIIEASKGKALGQINIPLFNQQKITFQGVQTDYEERLKAGEDADSAFWNSALSFGLELTFALGIGKNALKNTLLRKNPETLINRVAFDTQTVRDYISGRSSYLGVKVPQELKIAFGKLSQTKQKEVLFGIRAIDQVSPSNLGKILGITEQQAKELAEEAGLRIVSPARQLPGEAIVGEPQPAFGMSIQPRKRVGDAIRKVRAEQKATETLGKVSADEVKNALSLPVKDLEKTADYVRASDSFRDAKVYGFYVDDTHPLEITISKKGEKISHGYNYNKTSPKPPTSKPTPDPLTTQARQAVAEGKTVEEFVEAQPKVFHGTDADFKNFESRFLGSANGTAPINRTGFSFTSSPDVAKTFGKNLVEAKVDIKNPFVIDAKGRSYADEMKTLINDTLEKVDRKKYDGIVIKNYGDAGKYGDVQLSDHYIPFNESQIKTKSQLTKAFEEARGGSLSQEARKAELTDGVIDDIDIVSEKESFYKKISRAKGTDVLDKREIAQGVRNSPIRLKFKKDGYVKFPGTEITSPADIAFAFTELQKNATESVYIVAVKGNQPIGVELLTMGTINASLIDPFDVFPILKNKKADSFYVVHNHPSGDPTPSEDDIGVSLRLREGGSNARIQFKGHIVINTKKFGYIAPDGSSQTLPFKTETIDGVSVPHFKKYLQWTDKNIIKIILSSPEEVVSLMKGMSLNWNKNSLVFFADTRNRVLFSEILPKRKITENKIGELASIGRAKSVFIVNPSNLVDFNTLQKNLKLKYAVNLNDMLSIKSGNVFFSAQSRMDIIDHTGIVRDVPAKAKTALPGEKAPKLQSRIKGLGEAPSPVNKVQVKNIEQTVSATIPQEQNLLKGGVSQELQNSEIVSSLPQFNNISTTKSISKEFSEYKKAETGIRGVWVKIRETVQDNFIRVRKLQDRVNKGAKIPDDINVSQAETLFHGRVNTRLEDVKKVVLNIDKEIVKTAKELNISADKFSNQIDSFLHARHALERNTRLGDGAAGLTNVEAQKILNNIDNLPNVIEIKEVAEKIQDLNRKTLKILLDSEVIGQELFDLLNSVYKNHIPLQRVLSEQGDLIQALSGKGFDVRSTGIKKAVGSDKPVADILTNVTANAEQAIIRAEKNLVDLVTLRFARANKDLGVFEEITPPIVPVAKEPVEKLKEIIEIEDTIFRPKPELLLNDPTILTLREKGKPVFLKIKDKQLAVALKGVNVERVPALMRGITYVTRLYASLHTRFNYEFAFSNNVRDVQEMMVDVASRKGMGFGAAGKAFKKDPQSKKAVFDYLMGKDTEGARLYQQMKADGGTTGGLGLSTREQVELDIETIRKLNRSNPRKAALKVIEVVDKWNTLFEDATRLSVYRTAIERGLSRKEAAFLAKESTVNFNKKGTAGPIINGLYMFSNASIQGSTKILRAMKNPKVLFAVIASVGTAVYAVNEWNDEVDPDWRDKITKWDRSSNLTIMLPTEGEDIKYITIPISWGLKPIKVSLEYVYDASTGHGNLRDATQGVLTSVLESYNPLAGDESILNTVTPTILKVPMEISRNRAWYGNSIKPDYDPNIPASAKYFKSLENTLSGRISISATNKISETTNGAIEISPADINYAYNQYIGGVGRSISRIIDTIVAATTDKELEAKERPVLNRFLKETDEEKVLERLYYTEKERIDKEKAKQKNRDVKRITPIYDTAQMLLKEGKGKEAQDIVDNLSDEDYEIYKKMKASDKRRQTQSKQIQMFRVVSDIQELVKSGKKEEARNIVNAMTDEEYDAYKNVKKQLGIE